MPSKILVNGLDIPRETIKSASLKTSHAMMGETLAADETQISIVSYDDMLIPSDDDTGFQTADENMEFVRSEISDFTSLPIGADIVCTQDSTLICKHRLREIKQIDQNTVTLKGSSVVGDLANKKHYGGIYTNVAASNVFASLLNGFSYTVDGDIANAVVNGYLPAANCRDNLQQLLFAVGGTIKVNADGSIRVSYMSTVSTGDIGIERIFSSGASVEDSAAVTGVEVTEHNYFPSQEADTLYNDGLMGTETIVFEAPHHSLSCDGGTIVESGANYAVIRGNSAVLLTGKKYTHVTRQVIAGDATGNVKKVSNAYMVNPQIAEEIAQRTLAYLQKTKKVKQSIILGGERAGDMCKVINPYTLETKSAAVVSMDINLSNVNKANAEFLLDYVPSGAISGFKNYVLLTGNGTWTVPSGTSKIRVIIVGAGSGGSGGSNGENGEDATIETDSHGDSYCTAVGAGGVGGKQGKAGDGGKVLEVSVLVSGGQSFSYSCGIGGTGGGGQTDTTDATEGTAGTETTFGAYSSDSGRVYKYGYVEPKTGNTFCAAGADGFAGGKGGDASRDDTKSQDGESVNGKRGGKGSTHAHRSNDRYYYDGYPGGGGGASGTSNGGDSATTSTSSVAGNGADGGNGANATSYGQGGGAGNGGGGGGGAGYVSSAYGSALSGWDRARSGIVGTGGSGGNGGNGGNGCIVVYY